MAPGLIAPRRRDPEHHVGPLRQRRQQFVQLGEVVGVVGVAHHHDAATSGGKPGAVGVAVAPLAHVDEPDTGRTRNVERAVGRAVVGDDDLPGQAGPANALPGPRDGGIKGFGLIETGITTDTSGTALIDACHLSRSCRSPQDARRNTQGSRHLTGRKHARRQPFTTDFYLRRASHRGRSTRCWPPHRGPS